MDVVRTDAVEQNSELLRLPGVNSQEPGEGPSDGLGGGKPRVGFPPVGEDVGDGAVVSDGVEEPGGKEGVRKMLARTTAVLFRGMGQVRCTNTPKRRGGWGTGQE